MPIPTKEKAIILDADKKQQQKHIIMDADNNITNNK